MLLGGLFVVVLLIWLSLILAMVHVMHCAVIDVNCYRFDPWLCLYSLFMIATFDGCNVMICK